MFKVSSAITVGAHSNSNIKHLHYKGQSIFNPIYFDLIKGYGPDQLEL